MTAFQYVNRDGDLSDSKLDDVVGSDITRRFYRRRLVNIELQRLRSMS